MHIRTTTLTTRMLRFCRMMGLVVVVAMLQTRLASANLPCGDKNAEMPQDLVEVFHKLKEGIKAGDPTYFNKLIVPNVYDGVRDHVLRGLNELIESASPRWGTRSWSRTITSGCEALEKQWICLSRTEGLPEIQLGGSFVHVGNIAGTLLKEAPRRGSTTIARLRCREFLYLDGGVFYNDGTYWHQTTATNLEDSPIGYVKNNDLVRLIPQAVRFARIGGIWRIVELHVSNTD